MSSTTGGHRRRRLTARAASGTLGCGEKDPFVTRRLCPDGVSWQTPGCGGFGSSRSVGLSPVSTGFSVGTAVVLVLLLAVLIGWYRRWAMLRRLSRISDLEEESADPERPLRSSLKQRRKQRRIQRLLRLRQQHVHFNEAVDVNEFLGMSATTVTSTSEGRSATPLGGRGRHGSIYVSQERQASSDEDADEEDTSGAESGPHPGTSTENDKDK